MKDFIIDYIPKKSKSIDDIQFKSKQEFIEKNKKTEKCENIDNDIIDDKKNDKYKNNINVELIEKFINILSSNYYNDYDDWIKIGMILKYLSYKYNIDFFELFNNFSKKSLKYNENDVKKYWDSLKPQCLIINMNLVK
jgi:hypothetical protein